MRRRSAPRLGVAFLLLLSVLGGGSTGFLRAQGPGMDRGELLLGELNCVACHAAPAAVKARLSSKAAPLLGPGGVALTPQWLRAYLRDPHGAQPGTTMPDLLHGLPPADKEAAVEALTHYLVSLQGPAPALTVEYDAAVEAQGRALYHTVGCVACHAPQEAPKAIGDAAQARQIVAELQEGAAPLGDLAAKTTVAQLAAFLKNPLASRPSGRMPASNLGDTEAVAIATYLQRSQKTADQPASLPGLRYEYYEEALTRLPRFDRLEVRASGIADQINLAVTRREDNVALRFRGNLTVPAEGEYTFTVLCDDGARLLIDDKQVLENDGVHPATEGRGRIVLTRGDHALTLLYFNGTGERALNAYWEGPGLSRQEIPARALTHSSLPMAPTGHDPAFAVDAAEVERGRELFTGLGCASCHGNAPSRAISAKALADLDPRKPDACIALHAAPDRPQFVLAAGARDALQRTLAAQGDLSRGLPAPARIVRTMAALNCYACHARDGHGGPEGSRRDFFAAVGEADLGDEGRFPPALTGVGNKLRPTALEAIFWEGATARPYMATRMPQFGRANMEPLVDWLAMVDHPDAAAPSEAEPTDFPAAPAAGRKLAGTGGLACIACHNFAGHASLGVPAIDMTLMASRLNPGWFRRYLLDPQALRPGTRMPAFWPDGKASNTELLGGDTARQIDALRLYLAKGKLAELPDGLIPAKQELVARREAVIYRNFIAGAGPRAIGVGYPEKANLVFDAGEGRLAVLWQGPFIDASRHRSGRGHGAEPPLGGNVVSWTPGPAFARLAGPDAPWPRETGAADGYRFGGYRLDDQQRPTFRYRQDGLAVEDYPVARQGEVEAGLHRTLRVRGEPNASGWYFRAAEGSEIAPRAANSFLVEGRVTVQITGGGTPVLRTRGDKQELLVPLPPDANGQTTLEETLTW